MDFNYDNQNQPSQQPHHTKLHHKTTTPLHPHHPAINLSLPQHLQLQPASQQHGSFLQSHHHSDPPVSGTTSPHHHHPHQGGQSVPFLPHGVSLGFAPIPGGEGGETDGRMLQQDVLPISHLPQVRDAGQVLDNLFGSVTEQGIDNPPADHLEHTVPSSLETTKPLETSIPQQLRSPSITTPIPPTRSMQTTESTPRPAPSPSITTTTQPTRPPLAEKQPLTDRHENLQRNPSQEGGKIGNSKKTMVHANLPEGFNYQFADEKEKIIKGVVVNRVIQKGQWFGPFNGSLLDEEAGQEIGSTWEICLRGDVKFYVDARNKIYNNWLYHINPARSTEEQNLEAFQHYGDIYFRALEIIQPCTELKVFYSDEYREKIGSKMKLDDLDYDKESGCFKCPWCENPYQTSKSMLRHIKITHSNRDRTSNMRSNLKERISKKTRLMEAVKQPSREKSFCEPPETAGSKEPTKPSKEGGHFVCVTCGNHFPTNGRLLAHELFHESTVEKFECDMCDAVYKTSLSLMRHKKLHEGLQYRCTLCSKMYTTRGHLSRHMNTAHGFGRSRGQIICKACSRTFCLEDDMMQHLRSCKGLQMQITRIQVFMTDKDESFIPYEKFGCDPPSEAAHNASPSLPRHSESQTDHENKCTICHKAYSSRSHLSRHMHTKHGFGRLNGKIVCIGCSTMFSLDENMSHHFEQCTGLQEFIRKKKKRRSRYFVKDDDDDDVFIPNEKEDRSDISKTIEAPVQAAIQPINNDLTPRYLVEYDDDGFIPHEEMMQAPKQAWDQSGINDLNKKEALMGGAHKQGDDGKSRVIDMLGIRMDQDASRPFKCCYCTKRFFTKNRLHRHKWERHPNASVFKCDQCDRTFPNKFRLIKHQASHNKEKHYKCQLCPRSFASESALCNHQKEHTGAKPHKCETCMKGFRTRRFLTEHKRRIHSVRELRFACSICDKKFAEKNYLVVHERRHTGIRPYVCLMCGKAFKSKFCLANHSRVHSGEKPFKCHICEKTFSLNHHLHDHLYTHGQSTDSTAIVQGSTLT